MIKKFHPKGDQTYHRQNEGEDEDNEPTEEERVYPRVCRGLIMIIHDRPEKSFLTITHVKCPMQCHYWEYYYFMRC